MEGNKQVRVDNWGVFFLQRLQVFFNKTDYCDLTLQFEGNVQLKVHRLVMSACTDYFSVLEHTCEMIDGNTIVMPEDLQADVILPIVNFMYTGMLEFPMSIYDKLYRTAGLMNIPILVKLLEAQRRPIKNFLRKQQLAQSMKRPQTQPRPEVSSEKKLPIWKRKSINNSPSRTVSPQLIYNSLQSEAPSKSVISDNLGYDNTPRPTRFEWPEEDIHSTFNLIDSAFDDISYTSKPLLTQDDELRATTSAFDELKYSCSNLKKSKDDEFDKKNQSEIIKDYDDEDEDDPEDYLIDRHCDNKRKLDSSPTHSIKKLKFTVSEKENKETTISVTPKSGSEVDHTKIISEVLKRYPHLVKKNKNIKLKIMAKKEQPVPQPVTPVKTQNTVPKVIKPVKQIKAVTTKIVKPQTDEGPWVCKRCSVHTREPVEFVLYYLYRKHMTDVHHERFDSMMCKHCGHQSSKENLLMYHQYTKHGVRPPSMYSFPKCPRCPFIALTESFLEKHLITVHSKYDYQCAECQVAFNSQQSLLAHGQITGHTNSGRNNYDCQYCTKRFSSPTDLFGHIKSLHRDEARRDGIVSIDETEDMEEDSFEDAEESREELIETLPVKKPNKIEIVSDMKISEVGKLIPATSSSQNQDASEVIRQIEGTNQGIVDIVVLDENQQYILQNQEIIQQQQEYILPEIQTADPESVITSQNNVILQNPEIASTDELVMVLTDHDYNDANNGLLTNDNSNIVVLYSHPVDGQQNEFITSEGKLILNPQTGLLELRNDTNENSQDAQIESIEMIQREINNGLVQTEEIEKKIIEEEVPEAMEIDESCNAIEKSIEEVETFECPEFIEPQTESEEVLTVESKEVESGLDGKSEIPATDETVSKEESLVFEETVKIAEASLDLELISTENPKIDESNLPETELKDPLEEEKEDLKKDSQTDESELKNSLISDIETNNEEQIEKPLEEVISEEIPTNDTQDNNLEVVSEKNETQPEEEVNPIEFEETDSSKEKILEITETLQSELEIQLEPKEDAPPSEKTPPVPQEEVEDEVEKETVTINKGSEVPEAAPQTSTSVSPPRTSPNITASIDYQVTNKELIEEEAEEAEMERTEGEEEEVVEEEEEEEENSQDEGSCSGKDVLVATATTVSNSTGLDVPESTKISILNDWEDTEDSQQSEGRDGRVESAVHKLIDDWDDDDEEGTVLGT